MQNFKEVCGNNKSVWFEMELNEGKKFLKWAKDLGCVWANGEQIEPEKGVDFFHLSISNDGKLAYVLISAWVSRAGNDKDVKKTSFSLFKNHNLSFDKIVKNF